VSASVHIRITGDPLSLESCSQAVSRPRAGAIVVFCGVTREIPRLEYEAYREMAEEKMRVIVCDCLERYGLAAAAAEHRVGAVALGEPSVIVAVSATHRAEAFAGASEIIDRIKAQAPIWKREIAADGSAQWARGSGSALADAGGHDGPVGTASSAAPRGAAL
jgi:MoaE-MoaD fusion protein